MLKLSKHATHAASTISQIADRRSATGDTPDVAASLCRVWLSAGAVPRGLGDGLAQRKSDRCYGGDVRVGISIELLDDLERCRRGEVNP